MSIFSGGKGNEIAAVAVGIANELMLGADNEDDLRRVFNMIARKIVERYEELIGDEENEEE